MVFWSIFFFYFRQHYSMNFLLQQKWVDKRTQHNVGKITLSGDTAKKIWNPDTRIIEEKKTYPTRFSKKNKLMHIYANGTIISSERYPILCKIRRKINGFGFFLIQSNMYLRGRTKVFVTHASPQCRGLLKKKMRGR